MNLLLAALLIAPAADLRTLSGKSLSGELTAAGASGVTLQTAAGPVTVPLADVLAVETGGTPVALPADRYTDVGLLDGSLLHCRAFKVVGKKLEAELLSGKAVAVPLAAVASVLNDAHDAKVRAEWNQILAKRGKRDLLVVPKDDRLEAVEGTLGEGTEAGDRVSFEPAGGPKLRRPPLLSRLQGLVFAQRLDGVIPPTVCKVTDAHRNYLVAAALAVSDKGVTVTTVAGAVVTYAGPGELLKLDFSQGKLLYLSDLEPAVESEWATETGLPAYAKDRNLVDEDGPIRLKGAAVARGLAVHAGTELAFDVGGDYAELRTVVGIDDAVSADVAVKLKIEGDGRELFAGVVRRKDEPKTLVLDVKGVRQLRVTAEAAEGLDLGKHVTLADAKVSK